MRASLLLTATLIALPATAQDWVAGVEATSNTSNTWVTHYSRSGPIIYWQTVSYLTYRANDGGAEITVTSPGIAVGAMYRWHLGNTSAGLGGGYEMRWTERQREGFPPTSETEQGPIVEGDLSQRLARRTSARLAARWSGANQWRAASAEVRQEIGARFRVGPQLIWQGNEDIDVFSLGGLVEIPLGDTWLQLRGGQARIEHPDGTTATEPYFSVGIVVPF